MPRAKSTGRSTTPSTAKRGAPSVSVPTAADFEKLGVFYLGRPYDVAARAPKPGWLLYDSKDLVTHAVCIGMTGSGKTGLCLALLEEAAIDGIPAIIIDPKGDLSNLLLTFPQLRAEDFEPWINDDDARKQGMSAHEYAAQQAELWKAGLAKWGQDGARIARFRESADCAVYTPGSSAGLPISILKSFACPVAKILDDPELLRERIATTVTSLLGLLGLAADPIKSREHILLSTILGAAWQQGQDLNVTDLIHQIQTPPLSKVGVMDLEIFYPARERFELAMQLNNLLAAPSFASWLEGEPLDMQSLLYTPAGKPRLAIFSIAHLNDAERMFFVSLLLNVMLEWVRAQSGTTTLRALLYMDEIFGYFPPVANPPSKGPLLTLLKQARAFGVGVVLATQNPVDLDYKGLANTGTWFIGRLQTERDKARVLEGLEGASISAGSRFDRQAMEATLAGLGNRVFLMNNVHEDEPVIFETRWVMSYLRGPLTRTQIKQLMAPLQREMIEGTDRTPASVASASPDSVSSLRPVLPPDIPQGFVSSRGSRSDGEGLVYQPVLLGTAHIRFVDAKLALDVTEEVSHVTDLSQAVTAVDWDRADQVAIAREDMESAPEEGGRFAGLSPAAGKAKQFDSWKKDYANWLYRTAKVELLRSPSSGLTSVPGEAERDFRVRLQQSVHEQRDQAIEQLRRKYASKITTLQDRIRRAEQAVEREKEQAKQSGMQAMLSVGATILGAFMGRKALSRANINQAATALGKAGRTVKDTKDVGMAEDNVAALQQQLAELEGQFKAEADAAAGVDPLAEPLDRVALRPKKTHIAVTLVTLAWMPYRQAQDGTLAPAWQ